MSTGTHDVSTGTSPEHVVTSRRRSESGVGLQRGTLGSPAEVGTDCGGWPVSLALRGEGAR